MTVGIENDEEKEEVILRTAGAPVKIELKPDRNRIKNSRNDLSYVSIELLDENGLIVPDADCKVHLSVSGEGEIAAAGNASPTDMDSFRSLTPKTFHGKALAIVRPTGKSGIITLKAVAEGLPDALVKIEVK